MNILSRLSKLEKVVETFDLQGARKAEVYAVKDGFEPYLLYSYPDKASTKILLTVDEGIIGQWKIAAAGSNPYASGYNYDLKKALEHFGEST